MSTYITINFFLLYLYNSIIYKQVFRYNTIISRVSVNNEAVLGCYICRLSDISYYVGHNYDLHSSHLSQIFIDLRLFFPVMLKCLQNNPLTNRGISHFGIARFNYFYYEFS